MDTHESDDHREAVTMEKDSARGYGQMQITA